jgi:hypothetical protein
MANAIMVAAAASTSDIAIVVHLQCALVLPRSNASLHIIDCQSVKMQCATVRRAYPDRLAGGLRGIDLLQPWFQTLDGSFAVCGS